jgi:hypothetical protein
MKPTLPDAIVRVLLARTPANGYEAEWRPKEIIAALRARDWMPNSKIHAEGVVQNTLRKLTERAEIIRCRYGIYALHPRTRARFNGDGREDEAS